MFEVLELASGSKPSLVMSSWRFDLSSKIRRTIFSPKSVGSTETRKSISLPAELELDSTVLGQAALGDVELAHDLDAADNGVRSLSGGFMIS
jgi:hypothetical protein